MDINPQNQPNRLPGLLGQNRALAGPLLQQANALIKGPAIQPTQWMPWMGMGR
jgi:hypothetical protein